MSGEVLKCIFLLLFVVILLFGLVFRHLQARFTQTRFVFPPFTRNFIKKNQKILLFFFNVFSFGLGACELGL